MASLMPHPVRLWNCLIILLIAGLIPGVSAARAQNVFQTKRVKIFYTNPTDLQEMERRLPFSPVEASRQLYFYTPVPSPDNPVPMLAAKVDGLLTRVCMILNMWPKKGPPLRIYLLKNGQEVRQRQLALQPFHQEGSFGEDDDPLEGFYDPLTRSIFLSLADLRVGVLGHEMTHYVLNEAFPVPPPASVQEHWAHYVERQLY
jgi:hypothetical protein